MHSLSHLDVVLTLQCAGTLHCVHVLIFSKAMLRHGSVGFCSGVIFKENMVLTTAQCVRKYSDFQVAVGECHYVFRKIK